MFPVGGAGNVFSDDLDESSRFMLPLAWFLTSPLPRGQQQSPSPGGGLHLSLTVGPQQSAQSGPGPEPQSLEKEGRKHVSQWLSAFPANSHHPVHPRPARTASSLPPPNFPFSGLSGVVLVLGVGHPPPPDRAASSAAWGCPLRHLGTMPAGLAGPVSGQLESSVMESLQYRSRCSQKGPGEDHLTGRWVTQREGEGWGAGISWPAGPAGGGQVVSIWLPVRSGCLSGEEEEAAGDRRRGK